MTNGTDTFANRGIALDESILALERTIGAGVRAQGQLRDRKQSRRISQEERERISDEIVALERRLEVIRDDVGDLDRLRRDRAFDAVALDPPTQDQKDQIADLVGEVDDLIQASRVASALFDAAAQLAQAAQGLRA